MLNVERLQRLPAQPIALGADRLSLYDRYSSLVYGILLRILNEPDQAQQVLIDLFASPQLNDDSVSATTIIRLARQMALEARGDGMPSPIGAIREETAQDNLPTLVFDLSFCQGHTLQAVADRLQMTYADAVGAIRDHFVRFRIYHHQ